MQARRRSDRFTFQSQLPQPDLVDLVLMIDRGDLDAARLRRDVVDTFAHRETHAPPRTLELPPEFWQPTFARMAAECGIDPDIAAQFAKVQSFYSSLGLP